MAPKSPSYAKRDPKVTQSDPQSTPELYTIIEFCGGKNECFFENGPSYTQSDSKIIAQRPSSDPKSPTNTQTDPKLVLKSARPLWPESSGRDLFSHLPPEEGFTPLYISPRGPPLPQLRSLSVGGSFKNLLVAAVACTFSIFGPTRPAHMRIVCSMWCPSDPKVTRSYPHRPKITPK